MPELQIDAGKVNTTQGWRDIKVAVFAKRPEGEAATASEWKTRELPKPTARVVVVGIETADELGKHCRTVADSLSLWMPIAVGMSSSIYSESAILGDGAEWIWNLADKHFLGVTQTFDIFHAVERIADGDKAAFGKDTLEAKAAQDRGVLEVVEKGYEGLVGWIGEVTGQMPAGGDGAALGAELNFFTGQKTRLGYARRLAEGSSIGSGMIEG